MPTRCYCACDQSRSPISLPNKGRYRLSRGEHETRQGEEHYAAQDHSQPSNYILVKFELAEKKTDQREYNQKVYNQIELSFKGAC